MSNPASHTSNQSTSAVVQQQIPLFVAEKFPLFGTFIDAYIKWGEQSGNVFHTLNVLKIARDIDASPDQLLDNLRAEYLPHISTERFQHLLTGEGVETYDSFEWSLIKHIRDFYRSKGRSESFIFLFRFLYSLEVTVQYPHLNIIKTSDGNWIEDLFVVGTLNGTYPFEDTQTDIRLTLVDAAGDVVGYSKRIQKVKTETGADIIQLRFTPKDIINRDIVAGETLRISSATNSIDEVVEQYLQLEGMEIVSFASLESFTIVSGGTGWDVGERIYYSNATTTRPIVLEVGQVGTDGSISRLFVLDAGVIDNVDGDPPVASVQTLDGSGEDILLSYGAFGKPNGYFTGGGRLSNNNYVLQDNNYYQSHSYAINLHGLLEEFNFNEFVKLAHPQGSKVFFVEAEDSKPVSYRQQGTTLVDEEPIADLDLGMGEFDGDTTISDRYIQSEILVVDFFGDIEETKREYELTSQTLIDFYGQVENLSAPIARATAEEYVVQFFGAVENIRFDSDLSESAMLTFYGNAESIVISPLVISREGYLIEFSGNVENIVTTP